MLSRFSCVQLCVILWMVRFLFHGILQVRLLQWIAMPSFRGSSWPRIEPASLMSPALAGRFFTTSTTWEDQTHGYRGKRGRYIVKLGLCNPSMCMLVCMCVLVTQSCPTLCNPMDWSPPGSFVHGDSPGKNAGVGCHFLLQGIFLTQGLLNLGLLYCRCLLYHLSHITFHIHTTIYKLDK